VIPGSNPVLTGYSKLIPPEIPTTDTFLQFLVNVHPEAQWVTQQVEISGDWDTWANGETPTTGR
jgi:hypothetical protein